MQSFKSLVSNVSFSLSFHAAHAFPVFFGGTKVNEDATLIESVPSLHLVYFVTADTKRQDAKYV
jgi:hypothetical protein